MQVDNSCITGESEPLLRTTECTNELLLETKNIAFFSTQAVEGTARGACLNKMNGWRDLHSLFLGIVVACGDHTVMGRIAGLTTRIQANPTPIAKELKLFMKVISLWACFLGKFYF